MKKITSMILCLVMVLAFATCAFANRPLNPGFVTQEPAEVTAFKAKVDAIPAEITLDSKTAIEEAEAAYDAMITALGKNAISVEKTLAQWLTTMRDARSTYDALVAAQEKPETTPETGDATFVVFAMVALSMTALVVLASKKREF